MVLAPSQVNGPNASQLRLSTETNVDALYVEWDELADRCGAAPFLRPGWITAWSEAFAPGTLEVLCARDTERLVGVVALRRNGRRVASPTNFHTPEFGFLADSDEVRQMLAEAVFERRPLRVSLSFLTAGGADLTALARAARASGYQMEVRTVLRSPYVAVDKDWASYERGLSRNLLGDLRRCRRRLAEHGDVSITPHAGEERLDEVLNQLFAVDARSWQAEAGSAIVSRERTRRFYEEICRWADTRGVLRVSLLKVAGQCVAMELGFEDAGVHFAIKSSYDLTYRRFSPGKVLLHSVIERAFTQGLASVELLGAEDVYKRRWAKDNRERVAVYAYAKSPMGRVAWTSDVQARRVVRRIVLTCRGGNGQHSARDDLIPETNASGPETGAVAPRMMRDLVTPAPERGFGWLSAVTPVDARRFRVADPALADLLLDAGAEVTETAPDVEVAPVGQLRGDAPVAIGLLGRPRTTERALIIRAGSRLVTALRVRLAARFARAAVLRLGYTNVSEFSWDNAYRLRNRAGSAPGPTRLRERFPERGLTVGCRASPPRSLLEAARLEAARITGRELCADAPSIRSGGLIVDDEHGVLRVAVGFGASQIRNQCAALASLAAAEVAPLVRDRVPWVLASGPCGLSEWSLEERLPGDHVWHSVQGRLLEDCVDFLVALHSAQPACGPERTLWDQVAIVRPAVRHDETKALHRLAEHLDRVLADVPRGFVHGDFFHGNLLTDGTRLVGVVDWDASGPNRPPMIDLLHLRHATHALGEVDFGPTLIQRLLPWARDGGDDIARSYCARLGISPDGRLLEALVFAYWLDFVSYHLGIYPFRWEQPLWLKRNVRLVLAATAEFR